MASLSHSFSVQHAEQYGIEEAILINHFAFWIQKNANLGRNDFDGRTWTYQTHQDIAAHFGYMHVEAVRRTISSLVKKGVLRRGNYSRLPTDRTTWYAFENEELFTIRRNQQIEPSKSTLGPSKSTNVLKEQIQQTDTERKHIAPPVGVAPPEIQKKSLSPPKKKFRKADDPRLFAHGELVKLLPEEYERLCAERGKAAVDRLITKMNFTLLAKGQTYKDYFMALNSWFLNAWNQPNGGKEVIQNRDPNAYREPDVDASGDVLGADGKWYDKSGNLLTDEFLEAEERAKEEAKKRGKPS